MRDEAQRVLGQVLLSLKPGLSKSQVHALTTYTLAGADGLFIAKEIGGDSVDLVALLTMHAHSVIDNADRMLSESSES
ncbi:hypothetical protein OHB26_17175 [Nocardia sp. NBC_01503]|uniref:hypothetical protein n=1 Tax=Nocardia sp. NBC_01503 TaxID=2975997 RepID=UPI002E7C52BD|nr:hypothetical protein [Nocardia sp. NBC_01503]WTL35773.1 hypothetical protein OHB26_17175 [Nocardia sp. NBC_01503]